MYVKSLSVFFVAVLSVATLQSQEQSEPNTTLPRAIESSQSRAFGLATTGEGLFGYGELRERDNEIKEAARSLRQAESGAERTAAGDKLRELLDTDYDSRLTSYEEYLDEVETKLQAMRDKLQRRREAKEEMIELRIKVLEAEADDLGWPSRASGSYFPQQLRNNQNGSNWAR